MNAYPSYVFVLPAYNEEPCLETLVGRIRTAMEQNDQRYQIVLVNDGSTDGTAQVAARLSQATPLTCVSHTTNRGLGVALRTGLTQALSVSAPESVIITMDADDTHDPAATPRLAQCIQDGYDIAIASRYGRGGGEIGVIWSRTLCSRVVCILLETIFPISGVQDYTSGYRMYRAEIVSRGFAKWGDQFVSEAGFTCMAEVLLKLRRLGARISEVPVPLRYDRKQGPSKMRVVETILSYLVLIGRETVVEATRSPRDVKMPRPLPPYPRVGH